MTLMSGYVGERAVCAAAQTALSLVTLSERSHSERSEESPSPLTEPWKNKCDERLASKGGETSNIIHSILLHEFQREARGGLDT